MDVIISQVFTGASDGAVLLLVALGLALTFGQMGVINMAHGEFLMAGAYSAYLTQQVVTNADVLAADRPPGGVPGGRAPGSAARGRR